MTKKLSVAVLLGSVRRDRMGSRAAQLVTRQLTYEIARYVFNQDVEFRRRAADDPVINAALSLAHGARTQRDLFARAPRPTARG